MKLVVSYLRKSQVMFLLEVIFFAPDFIDFLCYSFCFFQNLINEVFFAVA